VLNKTLEQVNFNKDTSLFEKYIKNGQLKVFLADNIKIALTVTECVFSMGLFYPNGQYDYSTDLISSNQQALQWGEGVFLEYLKHGTRLQL